MRLFFFSASSLYFLGYLNLPPVSYSSITAPTLPTPLCITSLVPPTTLPPLPSRPFLPWFLFRPASIITGYVFRVSRARPGRDNCTWRACTNQQRQDTSGGQPSTQ
ncbi:hypothetical protein CPAR01_15871 [Colletotrichum paranaense]|uniref:Secreted protein n=1 Tax=Colletotrichum paranaense TaxID=1914294 RepID=A0ABQ9RY12_9PEZI|nr:uncharacterized protein CPAR01_15871 [Colletotrichum paranaense]KAK1518222.1 hypothetical protein CPAR01_15871 [Colletotrichum paranaense]